GFHSVAPAGSVRSSRRGPPGSDRRVHESSRRRAACCGGAPATTPTCRRALSFPLPLLLVVVAGIEVDRTEVVEEPRLLSPPDVLGERLGHRLLLRSAPADCEGLLEQLIIESKIGRHLLHTILHITVCNERSAD